MYLLCSYRFKPQLMIQFFLTARDGGSIKYTYFSTKKKEKKIPRKAE